MTDQLFFLVWFLSFGLYLVIYTWWIPLKTQKKIESWLKSSESDATLLMSLDVITKKIREQMLIDFEEFMLPQARESFKKFWMGAMGNAAKELKGSEEGSNLSLLHNITQDLSGQPWYVQALASKMLPMITDAVKTQPKRGADAVVRMGLADER